MRSLRTRILLAMLGVAAVSLALAGWLFSRVTIVRFEELVGSERTERRQELDASVRPQLEAHYRERGNWSGAEELLAQMQRERHDRYVLLDGAGKVAGVSAEELRDATVTIGVDESIDIFSRRGAMDRMRLKGARPLILRDGERQIGLLYALPPGPLAGRAGGAGVPPAEKGPGNLDREAPNRSVSFGSDVNRGLLGVIALVLALATVVTLWLARRIVQPVEALTVAVERMRAGNLQQQVPAQARDEIGELGRAFNALSEKLARVEQLRRDMVSDVAHELRTPLTNIRAQIEAIQDGLAQPSPQVIASLHEEALHLARLVDDLRDLSLGDAGQLRIERQRLAPATAIEQAIGALQARAAERQITIVRNYNGALPEVRADPVRLGQILRNLLDNAIRHTPPGGQIAIEAHSDAAGVNFAIRDSGAGIAAEHLPNIFERFYRTDPSRARETGGAGLGLAIVKQLVTAHGGSVRADSAPGEGATFHFSIPA